MRIRTVVALCLALVMAMGAMAQEGEKAKPNQKREGGERREGDRRNVRGGRDRGNRGNRGGDWRGRMRQDMMRRGVARAMEMMEQGRPMGPEMEGMLDRISGSVLFRAKPMNAVDEAHYAIAEIYLGKEDFATCLKRLKTVTDTSKNKETETVWVTYLNQANLLRHKVGDVNSAIELYKKVKGRWGEFAQSQLLRTLEEMGNVDEAAGILKKQLDASKDPGERLSLMRRIAAFYKRNKKIDEAITYYDRITKEFTRDQVDMMVKAAQSYVAEQAEKITALRRQGKHEEAEQLMQQVQQRLGALRGQGRHEEANAMERAGQAARRHMEAAERDRDGRPDRPRPAPPPVEERE